MKQYYQDRGYWNNVADAVERERRHTVHVTNSAKKPVVFLSLPRDRNSDWDAATNIHAAARQETQGIRFVEAVIMRCDARPSLVGRVVVVDYVQHPDAVIDYDEASHRPILDSEGIKS